MTTYTAITSGQRDAESPIDETLIGLMIDNPIATAEGSSGAPDISGLDPYAVIGDVNGDFPAASAVFAAGFSDAFPFYVFRFAGLRPATSTADLQGQMSTNGGTSYITTGYESGIELKGYADASFSNLNSTTVMRLTGSSSNSSGNGLTGYLVVGNFAKATGCFWFGQGSYRNAAPVVINSVFSGAELGTTARNAIKFFWSTGNHAAGNIYMYRPRV